MSNKETDPFKRFLTSLQTDKEDLLYHFYPEPITFVDTGEEPLPEGFKLHIDALPNQRLSLAEYIYPAFAWTTIPALPDRTFPAVVEAVTLNPHRTGEIPVDERFAAKHSIVGERRISLEHRQVVDEKLLFNKALYTKEGKLLSVLSSIDKKDTDTLLPEFQPSYVTEAVLRNNQLSVESRSLIRMNDVYQDNGRIICRLNASEYRPDPDTGEYLVTTSFPTELPPGIAEQIKNGEFVFTKENAIAIPQISGREFYKREL